LASPLQKKNKKSRRKPLDTQKMRKFDFREAIMPFGYLEVTQAFRDMNPGEILQLTGDNPKTRKEIFKVLQTVHYTVVDTEEDNNFYCIRLRKEP
jgi:TusA-related sulfurtransferase